MYLALYYDRQAGGTVHLWDDVEGYKKFRNSKYAFKLDPKGTYTTLFGDKAVMVKKWSDEELDDGLIYESDIRSETRILIDKYLWEEPKKPDHRIMYLDIEVAKEGSYSTAQEAKNTVTAITINQDTTEKILLLSDTIESRKTESYELIVFKHEEDLLKAFIYYVKQLDPTILSGWNISGYDFPYLINRMRNLNIEYYRLSPIGIVDETRSSQSPNPADTEWIIAGRNILDYLYLYKKFTPNEETNYKLDTIARKVVGRGKIEYQGSLQNLYETDLEKFIEYNREDVQLVKDIDSKLLYIDLVIDLATTCYCNYSDIYQSSFLIDGASLAYLRKKNIVSPNKRYSDTTEEGSIEGAFVKLPEPGLYKWVFDLDLKALYPSIMRSLNISPETKVGRILNWDQEKYVNNEIDKYELRLYDGNRFLCKTDLDEFFVKNKIAIGSNGAMYSTDKKGFISEILEVWDTQRDHHKNLMKQCHKDGDVLGKNINHIKQYTYKIISNTFYGVLLLKSFRYGDRESGECITSTGQNVIKHSIKLGNYYFYKKTGIESDYCIMSDTDSCIYSIEPLLIQDNIDLKEDEKVVPYVLDKVTEIQNIINKSYDIYAEKYHKISKHYFIIKQEFIGKAGLWTTAKKRYIIWIINKEGMTVDEYDFKGVDVIRSNFPAAARIFMRSMIINILKENTKEEITEQLFDFYSKYNEVDVMKVMLPTGVKDMTKHAQKETDFGKFKKGTPAHVKAAMAYNMMLDHKKLTMYPRINDGDKILWTYLNKNQYHLETIGIPVDEVSPEILEFVEQNIDRKALFEKNLVTKIQPFFDTMKWGIVTAEPVNEFF